MDFTTYPATPDDIIGIDWSSEATAPAQSPDLIRARRDLAQRTELPQALLDARAAARRAQAKRRQFFPLVHALGLFTAGGLVSYYGHFSANLGVLLAGYGIVVAGLIAATLTVALVFDSEQVPLDRFYREEELPANAKEIGILASATRADPELARHAEAWWSGDAPIRKGDVRLALAFREAKTRLS